ncbi:MAG: DHA2 family efflux MFS transporter permease subunit [Candidatus Melainabacteria bacterium]|jgi:DHA2 family multidrug resistance protein|nr:DHA2 family efflux MFS transporter permease subunit [Candidatus Melainabacteria bacterium]
MATYLQEALQKRVDENGEIVRWLFLVGVAIAALIEVIDTSITNVALPHIQGNLGATTSEAAWVVTSYSIANVITMPLAVMFGDMFGKKRYFIFSMIGFTIASVLCGISTNLLTLVLARVMQGLFGGGLLAKAQAFLFEAFPQEMQGFVQAVFGICVIVGPVVGPTLGGWLTDNYNWRWIFFINIPIGIIATILCQAFIPSDKPRQADAPKVRIDWLGIMSLSVMLGSLQYVLEKGQDEDWFASHLIVLCTVATFIGAIVFFTHELRTKHPAVNLRIVRFRSVAIGLVFQAVVGFVLFGINYVIPNFAQVMLGYTALQAGLLQMPASLVTGFMFPVVGAMIGKFDARIMVFVGIACLSLSNWFLLPLTLDWGWEHFLLSSLIRGFGLVLVFLPLTIAAVGDCPPEDIQTAASLLSLVRTLGGGVGIAMLATILTRREDFHRAVLVEKITPYGTEALNRLSQMTEMFIHQGWAIPDARQRALAIMSSQVDTQAAALSFADIAWLLAIFTACTIPFCLLLGSGRRGAKVEMH